MEKNNLKKLPIISKMAEADLAYFETALKQDFDEFWNYSVLKQEFYGENTTYLVAKYDDEIVGFAGILTILDEANIMNIVTKQNKRGLGIATCLLQELINISKEKGMKSITLEVNEHNKPAINLYNKFEFKKVGTRKKYYSNGDTAILMTLSL